MCLAPINLKKETFKQKINDNYFMQQVPCGRCLECRKSRVNSWFIRLISERSVSDSAYFCTFTYDENQIPYSDNGLVSLNYVDWQRFVKRLRKLNKSNRSIKYFAVGEYGSKTHRPHYHALVFNVSDPVLFEKAWNQGFVHVGEVKDASVFYTLKYALKRSFAPDDRDPDDDRKPEKALMSKGLGISYLTKDMVKYHKDDVSRAVTMLGNKKIGLPRYYRDKLFNQAENSTRVKLLQEFIEDKYDKTVDSLYPQRVRKMYDTALKKLQKTD